MPTTSASCRATRPNPTDQQPTEDCPKPGLWHPNEMRHSAGSYMDHMGVPPKRVASILGHEGTRTTETVYIHGADIALYSGGALGNDHVSPDLAAATAL
jgi:Phage integrase family